MWLLLKYVIYNTVNLRLLTLGLYKGGGGAYIQGAYTWMIFCQFCVSNKQVSHKQENKHVLITRFD